MQGTRFVTTGYGRPAADVRLDCNPTGSAAGSAAAFAVLDDDVTAVMTLPQ